MKTYGLYINPFPGVWFNPSRLKSEAKHEDLAWWIKGINQDNAIQHFIDNCKGGLKDYIQKYKDDPQRVIIEEKYQEKKN